MPVILDPEAAARWLDPNLDDPAVLRALLVPYADEALELYPVSPLRQLAAERLAGVPPAGARSMKSTTALHSSSKRAMRASRSRGDPVDVRRVVRRIAEVPDDVEVIGAHGVDDLAPGLRAGRHHAVVRGCVGQGAEGIAQHVGLRVVEGRHAVRRQPGQAVQRRVDRVRRLPGGIEADREPSSRRSAGARA